MFVPMGTSTESEILAEIAKRNNTGKYFESGGAALYAATAKTSETTQDIPDNIVTIDKLDSNMVNNRLENIMNNGDFANSPADWAVPTQGGSFTANGYELTHVASSTQTYGWNGTGVDSRMTMLENHRYAFYVDLEVTGAGIDNYDVTSLAISTSPAISVSKTVKANKRQYVMIPFDMTVDTYESGSSVQPYLRVQTMRDSDNTVLSSYTVDIKVYSYMVIDLGVDGDEFYDVDLDLFGESINNLGQYWNGLPNREFNYANHSNTSTFSTLAEKATLADEATNSLTTDYVNDSWKNTRLLTVGHSLVSQQGWQNLVVDKLKMQGYSMYGVAGGTIQPKPQDAPPTLGMFSRDYVQDVISSSTNITAGGNSSVGLASVETHAIILWTGANDNIYSGLALSDGSDRIMTIAEQDEFELRNVNTPSTPLNTALTTGLVVTYKTLYLTMVKNLVDGIVDSTTDNIADRPEYRLFIVREPQNFREYDGTLDWGENHFEKNEIHKEVADQFSIPLIDLWNNSGINIWTRGMYLLVEDSNNLMIHLNDKGFEVCADYIAKFIKDYAPLDLSGTSQGSNLGFPTSADDLSPWITD